MKRFLLSTLCILALTNLASADTGSITISDAWSRASTGSTGVVYLTVTDTGAPDTLTGASTPAAANAKLHESKKVDGVMQMRPVDTLAISKAAPIKLAPGGYHLMLTGLTKKLSAGDTFPLTLNFAQAGAVTTTVKVEKAGAKSSSDDAMPGMDMGGMDMKGMDMGGMGH
jgi:copper(I)-binding protein